ncbi:MAG: hypothetical protein HY726_20640 [Candidatus Rokubacteria bacterium]|nr:hypothetical protein [Candidatus Rokubacteria bacterium]
MSDLRSEKVRKVLSLEGRAATHLAAYESALARIAPSKHRAVQLLQEARAIKVTLAAWELAELRRARSGV